MAIIEQDVDRKNEKLGLTKAKFSEYDEDDKVDCFEKWVDGILELTLGNEVQEMMKPIKEKKRERKKSFAFDEED